MAPLLTKYICKALDLGPLPVDIINAVLGTDLIAANVRLSAAAHLHIAKDHPEDYGFCVDHLRLAVSSPTFIGQAPNHRDNFELVRRVKREDQKALLVAVSLLIAADGNYRVRTCYLISAETVNTRRLSGRLRPAPPK